MPFFEKSHTGDPAKQAPISPITYEDIKIHRGIEPQKVYDLGKLLDIVDIGEQIERIEKRLINIEKMLRKNKVFKEKT